MKNNVLAAICLSAVLLLPSMNSFADDLCEEPSEDSQVNYSPRINMDVLGKGRLQFYSAPKTSCAIKGVFIIPGDKVIAYATTAKGDWTSVMYLNSKTGDDVEGWVDSTRLKPNGTAIGSSN